MYNVEKTNRGLEGPIFLKKCARVYIAWLLHKQKHYI